MLIKMVFKKGHPYGKRFEKGLIPWNKNKLGNLSEHKKIILLLMGIFLISIVSAYTSVTYQENANATAITGYEAYPTYTYDGSFSTMGYDNNNVIGYLYQNYTKPAGANSSSIWRIRSESSNMNLTNLSLCWDYNETQIELRVASLGATGGHVSWMCMNDSGWILMLNDTGCRGVYEEGIFWVNGEGEINVSLDSPTNNSVILLTEQFFNVSLNITGENRSYSWDNITYNVWFENGTLYNSTLREGLTGNSTSVSLEIGGFFLGSYYWNVNACYSNATYSSCNSSNLGNYTFSRGSTVNSFVYNNHTYETKREAFFANITLLPGAELSLAQLIYNGTTYTISNITSSGDNYLFYKEIDIPLNVNGSVNQTNVFYIRFNYGGTSTQTFGPYYQNSSFINLVRCNTDYTIQALNLTFYDEYNQKIINSTNNKTSLEALFNYWIGSGEVYKNYSFQNLTSTQGSYTFCIYPFEAENFTFKADMDSEYSALTYSESKYYLRNSTLTNISSDIFLYLIPSDYSTKFYLTFKKGVDLISDATVTVQKFFIGLGEYKTVSILQTDVDGKASMYQDLDATYRYSIVKDGVLLGTIEKVSICAAAPCSMTIYLSEALDTAFSAYDDYYAINILSNLSFNRSSSIVTYTFIDTTGLANYFRLDVKQSKLNVGSVLICNSTSYSSAGTLTCNLTGYEGDFIATGYISRSPEKVDRVLGFIIDADILEELGLNGVFIVMILLITLVIAAAIISKGNPSTVLFVLGISILGLKLIGIFPFSWVIVVTLEVLIIYMISKIKT